VNFGVGLVVTRPIMGLRRSISGVGSLVADEQDRDLSRRLGLGAIHPAIPNNAHRVRECMIFLAEHPDSSNREIATGIGITDQSQMSRLLARVRAR
jgi:hypothetical protein